MNLALAVVSASTGPVLLLDEAMCVVAASASFCRAFDIDCETVAGASLFKLGNGEWDVPQLRSLLAMTASGDAQIAAYDFQLNRPGAPIRYLVLHASKLIYGDLERVRLLLAVTDVTDARRDAEGKAALVLEHTTLLQEVRHRVANSLQIIASVLLQGARNTQSEEARGHLQSAHSRLMSVAALDQMLATSTLDQVELRSYFNKLCATIAASMIPNEARLRLVAEVDDTAVAADVSTSLGLIVTELVINALKHGYPRGAPGEITVRFAGRGDGWRLSVSDDGVGMPRGRPPKTGLGTSIVRALAKQLQADVSLVATEVGATVVVEHVGTARAAAQDRPAEQAV